MSPSFARVSVLIVVAGVLAVGCAPAAPAAPTTVPSAIATPTSAPVASPGTPTPAASATVAPTATSGSTPKPAAGAQVDLTFTGAYAFTAKGTRGRCSLSSGTPPSFGFEATEADYPGLGKSFSLLQFAGNDFVDFKWVIDDNNDAYGQAGPVYTGTNTITLSADHHSVTLDAQLSGLAPQGQPVPGPEHVTGTISCP